MTDAQHKDRNLSPDDAMGRLRGADRALAQRVCQALDATWLAEDPQG